MKAYSIQLEVVMNESKTIDPGKAILSAIYAHCNELKIENVELITVFEIPFDKPVK